MEIGVVRQLWRAPNDDHPMEGALQIDEQTMLVLGQYLGAHVEYEPQKFEYFLEDLADEGDSEANNA
jgi:hypothetical protein